jgi:hypothetical protein
MAASLFSYHPLFVFTPRNTYGLKSISVTRDDKQKRGTNKRGEQKAE